MILLVPFSVTTKVCPLLTKETWAGFEEVVLSGLVELAIGSNLSLGPNLKPEIFPLPPAFNTNTKSLYCVILIGLTPPEDTVDFRFNPLPVNFNDEIVLLPALTANTTPPSSES